MLKRRFCVVSGPLDNIRSGEGLSQCLLAHQPLFDSVELAVAWLQKNFTQIMPCRRTAYVVEIVPRTCFVVEPSVSVTVNELPEGAAYE